MNKYLTQYTEANKTVTTIAPNSKRPVNNWKPATADELQNHKGNWAWVLGDDDLVIDIDVKNGSPGEESLWELEEKLGLMFETSVKTPSGGHHIYLKKTNPIKTNKTLPDYPGIDFLRKGDICLIPGSKVAYEDDTEGVYTFHGDKDQFIQNNAPESLLNLLAIDAETKTVTEKPKPVPVKTSNEGMKLTVDRNNISEQPKMSANQVRGVLDYFSNEEGGDYNTWLTVGQALHDWSPEKGLDIWEEYSCVWDNYEPGVTAQKWDSFSNRGKGNSITLGTVVAMAKDNGYGQEEKEAKTKDNTPDSDETPNWCKDWVKVRNYKQFFNKETRQLLSTDDFNLVNGKYVPAGRQGGKPSAVKFISDNGYVDTVEDMFYIPSNDNPIVVVDGERVANSYNPGTRTTLANGYSDNGAKIIKLIREHIRNVFGDEERAVIFENWIAHQVQNPGQILGWAPIVQSIQGLGKTYFSDLLKCMIGSKNVGVVLPDQVMSGNTGWATGKTVNVLEELRVSGQNRYQITDKVKPLLTNKYITISEKYVVSHEALNTTNYILFTNHQDAIPLDDNDRRWWVTFSKANSIEEFQETIGRDVNEYFDDLYGLTDTYRAEIAKYFMEFQITDEFKAIKRAPMTQEKAAMIATEEETLEGLAEIKDIIENSQYPYVHKDVISSSDLFNAFAATNPELSDELKTSKRQSILKKLGFTKIADGRKKIRGKVRVLWTKRASVIDVEKAIQILDKHNEAIGHDSEQKVVSFKVNV